jgi:hypothetical protein
MSHVVYDYARTTKLFIHGEKMFEVIDVIQLHVGLEFDFVGQNIINKMINQYMHKW